MPLRHHSPPPVLLGLLGDAAEQACLLPALAGAADLPVQCFADDAGGCAQAMVAPVRLLLVSTELAKRHRAELFGPSRPRAVVVFAAVLTVDEAVEWMRAGAVDCLTLTKENLAGLPQRLHARLAARPAAARTGQNREALARRLSVVVEKVGDGLTLCDELGHLRLFNRQMRRITGYGRSQVGSHAQFLSLLYHDPGERRSAEQRVYEVLTTGEVREGEAVVRTRTGEARVLSVIVSPICVGGQVWLLCAYRDITVRKQAETVLTQREALSQSFTHALASLAGSAPLAHGERGAALNLITETSARALAVGRVSIWFLDAAQRELCCADLFEQGPGRHSAGARLALAEAPAYFAALFTRETIAASDALRDPATRESAAYLQALGIVSTLDVPIRSAGRLVGVVRHAQLGRVRSWSGAEQAFASAIGSCVSLVLESEARKQAEYAHQADRDRLHEIIEFLPDATFVIDRAGVVTAWNKAMEEMTGVPKAAMLGRCDHEYSLPLYQDRRPILIDLALHGDDATPPQYHLLSREGDTLYGESQVPGLAGSGRRAYLWGRARPLYDQTGRITGAIESIRDVTNRKLVENEVVAWKKRYELVAAASGQITYEYSLASGFILWSESVDRVLGYALAEMGSTLRHWMRLIHPADRRRTAVRLHASLRTSVPFDVEYRMRHKSGHDLWFRDRGYFILTVDGGRSMIGMLTDITESKESAEALRRAHGELEDRVRERTADLAAANARLREEIGERERAQQALATSERKYRLMVDSLPQVVYELDLQGNMLLVNREGLKAGRFSAEELARGINLFSLVHPRDHEKLRANWARLLTGDAVTGEEYLFLRRDGTSFPGTSYAQVITVEGQPVGVTGFLIDDTRRKQAEENLRRAHADLEERVVERTSELASSNASLRQLLEKQEMNIELAHQVLLLVNADSPRNSTLPGGASLFTAAQLIPRYLQGGDHFLSRRREGPAGTHTLVSLKDQSGHEVGCILRSIITDLVHNALLIQAPPPYPLASIVTRLNREICRCHLFRDGDFFTALDLEIDHQTLEMEYVAAGHPPFLLVRGSEVRLLPELAGAGTNLPVGMIEQHEYRSARFQLEPGDKLLLYTDGLLEVPALRGRPNLTSEAIAQIARELMARQPGMRAVPLARQLFLAAAGVTCDEAAVAHVLPDDVALFALEIEGPGPGVEDYLRPESLEALRQQRGALTAKIEAEWSQHGITASRTRLHFVLEEALYNAWHHGNRRDPGKSIRVRRRYGNDACIEIIDEGVGFRWDQIGDPTSHENRAKPSGRGLFMIRRFADEARWTEGGRHLTLFFGDEKTFSPPGGRSPLPRFDLWQPPHVPPVNQVTV